MTSIAASTSSIHWHYYEKAQGHEADSLALKITKYVLYFITIPLAITADLICQGIAKFRTKPEPPPPSTFEIVFRVGSTAASVFSSIYFHGKIFMCGHGMLNGILETSFPLIKASYLPAIGYAVAGIVTAELIKNIANYGLYGKKPSSENLNFLKQLPKVVIKNPLDALIEASVLKVISKIYYSAKSLIFG